MRIDDVSKENVKDALKICSGNRPFAFIFMALLFVGSLAFTVPSVHAETVQLTETYSKHGFSFKYPQGMTLSELGSFQPHIPNATNNLGIVFGAVVKNGTVDYTIAFMLSWNQTLVYDIESVIQSGLNNIIEGEGVRNYVLGDRGETSVKGHNVIYQPVNTTITIGIHSGNISSVLNVWYCDDSKRLIVLVVTGPEVLSLSEDYLDSFYCHVVSTTISCSVSQSEITLDDSITVSGSISPPVSDVIVTLTYTKPDGSTFTRTCTTNPGDYSDTYTPDVEGSWSVTASWDGDSTHEGASSSSKSFTVKKKGCIIATATYGSELSPEVQFLREFRDNTVLNTFAGSSFMKVFNGFYYSFSPSVATIIVGNSVLRDIMRVVLYPLIGILHLSSVAFSIFAFIPELGVVMAGLVASSLIGMVYFFPLALILCLVKKFNVSSKTIQLVGLFWVGCLIAIVISEISKSPPIMMVSTGAFVLATISVTTLTSLRIVTNRLIH